MTLGRGTACLRAGGKAGRRGELSWVGVGVSEEASENYIGLCECDVKSPGWLPR